MAPQLRIAPAETHALPVATHRADRRFREVSRAAPPLETAAPAPDFVGSVDRLPPPEEPGPGSAVVAGHPHHRGRRRDRAGVVRVLRRGRRCLERYGRRRVGHRIAPVRRPSRVRHAHVDGNFSRLRGAREGGGDARVPSGGVPATRAPRRALTHAEV